MVAFKMSTVAPQPITWGGRERERERKAGRNKLITRTNYGITLNKLINK
jgi:hypothetical protein